MSRRHCLLVMISAYCSLGAADPLPGQTSDHRLEEITVTATRSARTLDEVSRSVSIVTEEQIDTRQATDVLRILRELPGVSAASNGGLGGQLVVRGFSTQGFRAPLFVDGDRFRGRNTIEYTLFNPDQIERIEVVRGPASSLYGTDSLGGVINVVTKRSRGDVSGPFRLTDSRVSVEHATVNDLFGGRLQVGGVGNGFDVLLGMNYREAADYESPVGEIPNSGFEAPSFDLRTGFSFTPGHRIELVGRYADVERERAGGQFAAPGAANGPGVPQRKMTDRSNREKYLRLGYFGDSLFEGAVRDVEATSYWRDLETHVHVIPNARNPATFVDVFVVGPRIYGGHLKGVSDLTDNLSLTAGGDWFFEDRAGSERSVKGGPRVQTAPDTDQLSLGAYLLGEWQPRGPLHLNASIRFDHVRTRLDSAFIQDSATRDAFKQAGDTTNNPVTGSFGAVWDVTEKAILFGNIGTSFRAPSVTELSAVGTGVNPVLRLPNPDVKPERGINYEAGLRLRFDKWEADFTTFFNDLENLIDRDVPTTFGDTPAVQMQNIGEAEVSGIEMQVGWLPTKDWRILANATYTRGTDTVTDTPLAQIMPWNGVASARWEPTGEAFYLESSLEWATDQDRINPAQERPSSGYAVVNLSGGIQLDRWLPGFRETTMRLSVENVFDTKYRLPTTPENINFPVSPSNSLIEQGRNFILTVSTEF